MNHTQRASASTPPGASTPLAFTLVELLVVIGIIAVLISILLPSLNRARESANRTLCQSNMRQISMAILSYTIDNRDHFPAPSPNSSPCSADWVGWKNAARNTFTDLQDSALKQYIAPRSKLTPAVLTCPTDDLASHRKDSGYQFPYSYAVNWMICEPRDYANPPTYISSIFDGYLPNDKRRSPSLTRAKIHRASEIILLIDESSSSIDDGCWAPNKAHTMDGSNLLSIRHDKSRKEDKLGLSTKRGNVAYSDAHCEYIPQKDAYAQRSWDPTKGGQIAYNFQ